MRYSGAAMKLRRLRKFILITGTTLCVLIAAAFVLSAWWRVWVAVLDGPFIGVHAGGLEIYTTTLAGRPGYVPNAAGLQFALVGMSRSNGFTLPLLYPFAAVAIPTLLIWRFAPKFPSGHCRRCGYNLTGLTEARCPECGQPFEAKGDGP